MFNKLILMTAMLCCAGVASASQEGGGGSFLAEEDTRLFLPTPAGRLKNGKYAYFSFIAPKGFHTNDCPNPRKNSKGEVLCGECEGDFLLGREAEIQGVKREARIIVIGSHAGNVLRKIGRNEAEIIVTKREQNMDSKNFFQKGAIPKRIAENGYWRIFQSTYQWKPVVKEMIHYRGQCQFVTEFYEIQYSGASTDVDKKKEPIKAEDWLYGDAQEKLQASFRCEELSEKGLNGFNKSENGRQ